MFGLGFRVSCEYSLDSKPLLCICYQIMRYSPILRTKNQELRTKNPQLKRTVQIRVISTTSSSIFAALLFIAILSPHFASAQVNIEKTRVEDPEGLSFTLSSNVSIRAGNQERYDIGTSARLDYKIDKNHVFLLGNVGYGKSDTRVYRNRSFAHLRFNHDVSRAITAELFGQIENDEFTLLQIRVLAGVGIRVPYLQRENIAIYQGTSFMFEHEELDQNRVFEHPASITANRWNNYINIRLQLNENVSLFNTGYIQPRFDDMEDFRVLLDTILEISFNAHFSFTTSLNLRYDSRPPDGLESLDLELRNGFRLSF